MSPAMSDQAEGAVTAEELDQEALNNAYRAAADAWFGGEEREGIVRAGIRAYLTATAPRAPDAGVSAHQRNLMRHAVMIAVIRGRAEGYDDEGAVDLIMHALARLAPVRAGQDDAGERS